METIEKEIPEDMVEITISEGDINDIPWQSFKENGPSLLMVQNLAAGRDDALSHDFIAPIK